MLNCSEDYDYRNGLRKITDVIHFLFILPGVYEGVCVYGGADRNVDAHGLHTGASAFKGVFLVKHES